MLFIKILSIGIMAFMGGFIDAALKDTGIKNAGYSIFFLIGYISCEIIMS